MQTFIIVGLGGFLGANARYLLSGWAGKRFATAAGLQIPYGTLFVNVVGSILLAVFLTWAAERMTISDQTRLLIGTGFFGAFTTFSTYAVESMFLIERGDVASGIANILVNNGLCLFGVLIGIFIGSRM